MKAACEKWRDQLLEAALTGATTPKLTEHLRTCALCAERRKVLEERKALLDVMVPQLLKDGHPSTDFRARVLAKAEVTSGHKRIARWQVWTLASSTVAAVTLFGLTLVHRRSERMVSPEELAAAQRLAEWRAPSDSLLAIPGEEILKTTPKLGESYLTIPMKEVKEE